LFGRWDDTLWHVPPHIKNIKGANELWCQYCCRGGTHNTGDHRGIDRNEPYRFIDQL
jgi:hypothetical protein